MYKIAFLAAMLVISQLLEAPAQVVPVKQDMVTEGVFNPEETFNYYERYATGVRVKLHIWELNQNVYPNIYPFVNTIKSRLQGIDNLMVSYRDTIETIKKSGPIISWNANDWLKELNKQVAIINGAVTAIESMLAK